MAQEARDKREREKLYAAIESSSTVGRQLVDLDEPSHHFAKKTQMNGHTQKDSRQSKSGATLEEEHARDIRDEAPIPTPSISRPESPFTQHPTIDFDGLSWPSMPFCCL
jgi:GTP cyclohydrolase I